MHFEELKSLILRSSTIDVEGIYNQYCRESGSNDLENFLIYLYQRSQIDAHVFRELITKLQSEQTFRAMEDDEDETRVGESFFNTDPMEQTFIDSSSLSSIRDKVLADRLAKPEST